MWFYLCHMQFSTAKCSNTGNIQLLRIINECQLQLLSRNLRKFN